MKKTEALSDQKLHDLAKLLGDTSGEKLASKYGESELIDRLDYHGITLLAASSDQLPSEFGAFLKQRQSLMVANEALKREALCHLFNAFEQAGLPNCVLFKGSALAYSLYSQPWLRPRSDNDCLIDRDDYEAFGDVFDSLGYKKLFAIEGDFVSYQSTFSKHLAGKSVMNVDLHWRINNRQALAQSFDVHQLLADGQTLSGFKTNIAIPCKVDSLLIASLHRLGHHPSEERLVWLYDIHLLAEKLSEQEWQSLVEKAQVKQLCAITLDALKRCENLFDTQIPEQVSSTLNEARSEPSQLFLQRELPEWRYFMSDLGALKKPSEKLMLIKEHAFPPANYIRHRMNTRSLVLGHCKRLVRGIKRITRHG